MGTSVGCSFFLCQELGPDISEQMWTVPADKKGVGIVPLGGSTPVPNWIENGKQIYAISVPFDHIGSTYGAVPESPVLLTGIEPETWEVYR